MNHKAVVVGNLNMLRCLEGNDFPVVLATSEANRVAFRSRYKNRGILIPGPTRTPTEFVDALLALGAECPDEQSVLFYDGDADLLAISKRREELEQYYRFTMPAHDLIDTFIDKALFDGYVQKLSLPTPASVLVNSADTERRALESVPFPAIVKPASRVGWLDSEIAWKYGKGGKGFSARTGDELRHVLELCRSVPTGVIVQQLVEGPESNIESYHSYVSRSGEILGEFTGRKHRTYPTEFGRSSCVEVCDLPEVRELGRWAIERMNLIGVSKLDFKRDERDGKLFLLEVNPRFSIWNYPGAAAGVNLPVLAYEDLTGRSRATAPRFKTPTRWIHWTLDRKAVRAGGGSNIAEWWHNVSGNTVFTLWQARDPVPFVYGFVLQVLSLARRAVARLTRAVGSTKAS